MIKAKRISVVILSVLLTLAFVGCGFTPEEGEPSKPTVLCSAKINYHYEYGTLIEHYYQETYTMPLGEGYEVEEFYEPYRLGYRFLGWTMESGGTGALVGTPFTLVGSGGAGTVYDFYAKYEPIEFTVEYHLNGGENDSENPVRLTGEKSLKKPVREGYFFDGWYRDAQFETLETHARLADNDETEVHFYAKWRKIYKISYLSDIEGMELPVLFPDLAEQRTPTSYVEGFWNPFFVSLDYYFLPGYLFLGWTYEGQDTPENDRSTIVKEIPVGTAGDLTFTAHFLKGTDLQAIGAEVHDEGGQTAALTLPEGVEEVVLGEQFLGALYITKLVVRYEGDWEPKVFAPDDVTEIVYEKIEA